MKKKKRGKKEEKERYNSPCLITERKRGGSQKSFMWRGPGSFSWSLPQTNPEGVRGGRKSKHLASASRSKRKGNWGVSFRWRGQNAEDHPTVVLRAEHS